MILQIIEKKKNNQILKYEEIKYMIDNYLDNKVEDYQMSSFLMAIAINGMSDQELIDLTDIMLNSGEKMDLSKIKGIKVDKHSTGGVGDKTSLVLCPLLASCGLKVAKMSGKSLGHTGGTIDKLESIEGFKVDLTRDDFIKQVNEIGIALISQTGNIVPADKKIYALRDVSGTVSSIPLIASSIMSKKIASGADKIIIDVKVGKGALIKTKEEAITLANKLKMLGEHYKKETRCVINNMNQPLGNAVGNSLEVLESIETLKGNGPEDLKKLVLTLASNIISISKNISKEEAYKISENNLINGQAFNKFEEMIKYQHGNINHIEVSEQVISIKSKKTGFVKGIDALKIGELTRKLGAGRLTKNDQIDYGVGLVLNKKIGDYVLEDEELLKIYVRNKDVLINEILDCFEIDNKLGKLEPLIYEII